MKRYTCECPVCGTINKDLYLEDSQGWYVCEKCDTSVQAMEVVKRVCLPVYTPEQVAKAMSHLTETQVRRITLLSEGHSIREIARMEGVDHMVVSESIIAARKKFLKFF